jgi:hypothetical protein
MANFPDQLFSGDQRFDGSAHAVGTVPTSGEASGGIKRVVVADLWISGGCRGGSVGCIRSGDASVGHQRIAGTLGTENNLAGCPHDGDAPYSLYIISLCFIPRPVTDHSAMPE